jgi:Kae1-associated kinase Bud32
MGKPRQKLFSSGAEAQVFVAEWGGKPALVKKRVEKRYRAPALDLMLRSRRTRKEAKALRAARQGGVPCPELYFEGEFELVLQRLEGKLLSRKNKITAAEARQAGGILAGLHAIGITHGDFSTSNLIGCKDGAVSVIDFGLCETGQGIEQKADDLIVFEKSVQDGALAASFRKGYAKVAGASCSKGVFERAEKILARARYSSATQ